MLASMTFRGLKNGPSTGIDCKKKKKKKFGGGACLYFGFRGATFGLVMYDEIPML